MILQRSSIARSSYRLLIYRFQKSEEDIIRNQTDDFAPQSKVISDVLDKSSGGPGVAGSSTNSVIVNCLCTSRS